MKRIRVVTLNLAFYEWRQAERLELVVNELRELNPDVVLLQEVSIVNDVHKTIKKMLPKYSFYLSARGGQNKHLGQVILSKDRPRSTSRLDLSQDRVAQKVVLDCGGKKVSFVNAHLYFGPLRDKPRARQVEQILEFADKPAIIGGDFNAFLVSKSMKLIRARFDSAHTLKHGNEPALTYPSPLWLGPDTRHYIRDSTFKVLSLAKHGKLSGWGVPIDFIFLDKGLKVKDCRLVFDQPSASDPELFASDHFGVLADILV